MQNRTREILKKVGVVAQHGKEQAKMSNVAICPHCGNVVHIELTK